VSKRGSIVVIGGGTGTYTLLTGLKKYPVDISVIVSMMDSGGSNRVIRDEFGLLPTSDIRQCIVALASEDSLRLLRKLFTYRYNQGTGIAGMTFGNLFMAALTDVYGSQDAALQRTSEMLDVKGEIIPVTQENTNLVARYDNGKQVLGEHYIDEPDGDLCAHRIVELSVFPPARANKRALKAIREADLVVLGPGDLYTSIICNLVIGGMDKALRDTKAKLLYAMNLMTKYGQTSNFTAKDHLSELERYIGLNTVDICLVNNGDKFPKGVLSRYKEEKAHPVKDDLNGKMGLKVVRRSLISPKVFTREKGDNLSRSLVRHDSKKLAKVIMSLL
jgi:uncharacterized cofD-like protein